MIKSLIFPERAEKEERNKIMANERMVEINTPMYQNANETTLDEFIRHAMDNFETRVVTLYQMSKLEDEKYKDIKRGIFSQAFYGIFDYAGRWLNINHLPLYRFKINPKNINFETTIVTLKNDFEDRIITPEVNCNPQDSIRWIKDIPEWQNIFGKGEFPVMSIYAFRLGNTEYFAYTIGR